MSKKQLLNLATGVKKYLAEEYKCSLEINDNRSYFRFFSQTKNLWQVEITAPVLDDLLDTRLSERVSKMLDYCINQLVQKHQLTKLNQPPILISSDQNSDQRIENVAPHSSLMGLFSDRMRELPNARPILILEDKPCSGKTLFVRWLLKRWESNGGSLTYWWLDFNEGNNDIREFLKNFLRTTPKGTSYIILDNIECCGFKRSRELLSFFTSIVNLMQSNCGASVYLIVIQDSNRPIYTNSDYDDCYENVELLSSFLWRKDSETETITNSIFEEFTRISFEKVTAEVTRFFQSPTVDFELKKMLVNILFFAKHGLSFTSDKSQGAKLINYIPGIRISIHGEITSFTSEFAAKLIEEHPHEIIAVVGKERFIALDSDFLNCYYEYLINESQEVSPFALQKILAHCKDRSIDAENLLRVLTQAQQAAIDVADTVLSVSPGCPLFSNHLGSILFAAEALSSTQGDWYLLHAWNRIKNHIRACYIVNSNTEGLPEIAPSYIGKEGTYEDFIRSSTASTILENCIANQIRLHDELLYRCEKIKGSSISETEIKTLVDSTGKIKDTLFDFYLSPRQLIEKPPIDIDRFFRTYLLALLFEFEATAPNELRDSTRLKGLWKSIKKCLITQDECAYCYPIRVPWVTARMLLALVGFCKIPQPLLLNSDERMLSREIDPFLHKLANHLISCSITFSINGEIFRFWASGTGLWNSALETSIMCSFAIKERRDAAFDKQLDESLRFITSYSENWFAPALLADGIWAYRIMQLRRITRDNFSALLQSFFKRTQNINFREVTLINKNDRSLGPNHVIKTYIDLAHDFVNCRPTLKMGKLLFPVEENPIPKAHINTSPKGENTMKSVFVTYAWESATALVEQYAREVQDFVNYLNQHGVDATYDLALVSQYHNWNKAMIMGLQRDKIIVLLSKEYKAKADSLDSDKGQGVKYESSHLMELMKTDPARVILVKLESMKNIPNNDIVPICFSDGSDLVDLSKTGTMDGKNKLWARIMDTPISQVSNPSGTPPLVKTL